MTKTIKFKILTHTRGVQKVNAAGRYLFSNRPIRPQPIVNIGIQELPVTASRYVTAVSNFRHKQWRRGVLFRHDNALVHMCLSQ